MSFRMRWENGLLGGRRCEAVGRCITKWFRITRYAVNSFLWIRTLWRYLVRPAAPASATANLPAQEASGRYRRPGKLSCVVGGMASGAFTRNLRARENLIEPR